MGGTDDAAAFTIPPDGNSNTDSVHVPQSLQDKIAYMRNSARQLSGAILALVDPIDSALKTLPFNTVVRRIDSHGHTYATIVIRFYDRESLYADEIESVRKLLADLLNAAKISASVEDTTPVGPSHNVWFTVIWKE